MVMISRRVLPLMFLVEGISHHSFVLDLNGERTQSPHGAIFESVCLTFVVMCARLRAAGFGVLSVLHQDTIVEGRVVLTVFDSASFLDILDGSCPISMHARAACA